MTSTGGLEIAPGGARGSGFRYSQEEIFKDFFTSGHGRDIFQEMEKEFARMGMRFDPSFVNNLFFGGRNIFFQGFIFGPGRIRVVRYGRPSGRPQRVDRPVETRPWRLGDPGICFSREFLCSKKRAKKPENIC